MNGGYTIVDDEDYSWLSQWKWSRKQAQRDRTPYVMRQERNRGVRSSHVMHRIIMGTPAGMDCDHINSNGLDNRRVNLRNCTHSENLRNQRKARRLTTSGFKGVSFIRRDRWRAGIMLNRKQYYLGTFRSQAEAAIAYDIAAQICFGRFARPNERRIATTLN